MTVIRCLWYLLFVATLVLLGVCLPASVCWMFDVCLSCSLLYDIDHVTDLAHPVWLQMWVAVVLVLDLGN